MIDLRDYPRRHTNPNGGDPDPTWQQRFVWAVLENTVAAILLVTGFHAGRGIRFPRCRPWRWLPICRSPSSWC